MTLLLVISGAVATWILQQVGSGWCQGEGQALGRVRVLEGALVAQLVDDDGGVRGRAPVQISALSLGRCRQLTDGIQEAVFLCRRPGMLCKL